MVQFVTLFLCVPKLGRYERGKKGEEEKKERTNIHDALQQRFVNRAAETRCEGA